MRGRGLAFLIVIGVALLHSGNRVVEETSVGATQTPIPVAQVACMLSRDAQLRLIVPGPPPPGTTLIRLEIPKIEFSESVFPVGFEEREGQVVMEEPTQDTVWTLDLLDPLVREYGWGGRNYVVWAHRNDWGERWPELKIGDKILFTTVRCPGDWGSCYMIYYEAAVVSWRISPVAVETGFYQASEEPMLTLVTCHPEDDPNPRFRLVIRAHFSALTD